MSADGSSVLLFTSGFIENPSGDASHFMREFVYALVGEYQCIERALSELRNALLRQRIPYYTNIDLAFELVPN